MQKTNDRLIASRNKTIGLALFSFVMFYVFTYMLNPLDSWWTTYWKRPFPEIFGEWLLSLLFCTLISIGSVFIHGRLNRYLPWIEKTRRRLLFETVLNILYVIILVFLQFFLIIAISENAAKDSHEQGAELWMFQCITVSIFMALAISAINTGDYLITSWKNAALEATEHKLKSTQNKQAATEAELQALKLQLDPHFVFNNLSVLSELILEDQQLGYQYSENFAKVYRYLLVNSKKDLIRLEEELKFLKAYIFLIVNRAGNGVIFEIDINPDHLKLYLPPMTIQLLIENAMKHNKFLKSDPLKIIVKSGPDMDMIISNSVIPLQKKEVSSGLGLRNIQYRYFLLSDRSPKITADDSFFTVSIPLINHDKKHTDYRG